MHCHSGTAKLLSHFHPQLRAWQQCRAPRSPLLPLGPVLLPSYKPLPEPWLKCCGSAPAGAPPAAASPAADACCCSAGRRGRGGGDGKASPAGSRAGGCACCCCCCCCCGGGGGAAAFATGGAGASAAFAGCCCCWRCCQAIGASLAAASVGPSRDEWRWWLWWCECRWWWCARCGCTWLLTSHHIALPLPAHGRRGRSSKSRPSLGNRTRHCSQEACSSAQVQHIGNSCSRRPAGRQQISGGASHQRRRRSQCRCRCHVHCLHTDAQRTA